MFPQFASTAASLTRATSLMSKVGTDAYLYDEPEDGNIGELLNSKFEAEKVEGMKRLIALLSQGRDVSSFFPQVVKNVATTSLEVKKLVYIYLVHYAEKRPDEALLSINSFQKDLSDTNPLVRAWSLRAISGIRVRVVVPLVVMAVTKCSRDPSPYVRRCSAHALPKIYAVERELHKEVLEELVAVLLSDSSAGVVGAAASAFLVICPDKLSLLGPRFRKLCEMLPDVDEWGQVVLLDILMRYAAARYEHFRDSAFFTSPNANLQDKAEKGLTNENFDLSEEEGIEGEMPADVRGLLHCSTPLLRSKNSAVVMVVATVHWVLAPRKDLKNIVKPLLFLLRSSYDSQYVVLANIATFASQIPSLFASHFEEFFVRSCDTDPIRALKLDILTTIATESSIHSILHEFQAYVRDTNRQFAANTVSAIGRCAVRLPAVRAACVEGLLMLAKGVLVGTTHQDGICEMEEETEELSSERHLKIAANVKSSQEAGVVAQAVLALRSIVQQNPSEQEEVFARLVRLLDHMKVPEARAVVIWMVGEHGLNSTRMSQMLPVVLRYLAGSFMREADETKLQILNCTAKVVLRLEEATDSSLIKTAALVFYHTLNLGDQDTNNDIRDRARLLRQLVLPQSDHSPLGKHREGDPDLDQRFESLGLDDQSTHLAPQGVEQKLGTNGFSPNQLSDANMLSKFAKKILLMPKTPPVLPALAPDRSSLLPGTMSHIVNHQAPGYKALSELHSLDAYADENALNYARDMRGHNHEEKQSSDHTENETGETSTESGGGESDGYSDGGPYDSSSDENRYNDNLSRQQSSRQAMQPQQPAATNLAPLISIDEESLGGENMLPTRINGFLGYGLPAKSEMELNSWLDSPETESQEPSRYVGSSSVQGYATLSLGPLSPSLNRLTLLDFTNGDGLDVKYCFLRTPSTHSQSMVVVRLYIHNRSGEPMLGINVKATEGSTSGDHVGEPCATTDGRTVVPFEAIKELAPRSTNQGDLHVDFKQQLTPIKLDITMNGKAYPVRLAPEVGVLLRPLQMTRIEFKSAESRIAGMHESSRRCDLGNSYLDQTSNTGKDKILLISQAVASGVLRVANVAVVIATLPISDATGPTGLQIYFAGETLAERLMCLISVTFATDREDRTVKRPPVLIKVNCEDMVFGLNLLKQLEHTLNS